MHVIILILVLLVVGLVMYRRYIDTDEKRQDKLEKMEMDLNISLDKLIKRAEAAAINDLLVSKKYSVNTQWGELQHLKDNPDANIYPLELGRGHYTYYLDSPDGTLYRVSRNLINQYVQETYNEKEAEQFFTTLSLS